jgi:hypothetical protein
VSADCGGDLTGVVAVSADCGGDLTGVSADCGGIRCAVHIRDVSLVIHVNRNTIKDLRGLA